MHMHMHMHTAQVGQALLANEYIEFETNPFAAYPKTHLPPGIRPLNALPQVAAPSRPSHA